MEFLTIVHISAAYRDHFCPSRPKLGACRLAKMITSHLPGISVGSTGFMELTDASFLSLSLFLYLSFSVSLPLSLYLSFSISLSLFLYPSFSISLCIHICATYVHIFIHIYICMYLFFLSVPALFPCRQTEERSFRSLSSSSSSGRQFFARWFWVFNCQVAGGCHPPHCCLPYGSKYVKST